MDSALQIGPGERGRRWRGERVVREMRRREKREIGRSEKRERERRKEKIVHVYVFVYALSMYGTYCIHVCTRSGSRFRFHY